LIWCLFNSSYKFLLVRFSSSDLLSHQFFFEFFFFDWFCFYRNISTKNDNILSLELEFTGFIMDWYLLLKWTNGRHKSLETNIFVNIFLEYSISSLEVKIFYDLTIILIKSIMLKLPIENELICYCSSFFKSMCFKNIYFIVNLIFSYYFIFDSYLSLFLFFSCLIICVNLDLLAFISLYLDFYDIFVLVSIYFLIQNF
jgi:hypothetical protein